MFVFEFMGKVASESLQREDSGCVSQSTITVVNASLEGRKRIPAERRVTSQVLGYDESSVSLYSRVIIHH